MPIEARKLKKMLMPAVTGRVGSKAWKHSVSSLVKAMPRAWLVSETSFPEEYMTTQGWL